MAIQKTLSYSGYSPDYSVITDCVIDIFRDTATVVVSVFKDSAAYSAMTPPLFQKSYPFSGSGYATYFDTAISTYSLTSSNTLERCIHTCAENALLSHSDYSGGSIV